MSRFTRDLQTALLLEVGYTLFTFLLTLFCAYTLFKVVPELGDLPKTPLWQILLAFGIGTSLILVALRFVRRPIFFQAFFSLALFLGWQTILGTFLPIIPALILAGIFLLGSFAYPKVWLQNLVLVVGLSGLAIDLGLTLKWQTTLVLLVVLSLYDLIAVYKTKHMVKMAAGLIQRHVFPALILPHQARGLKQEIKGVAPGKEYMFLGSGDLVFPLIFSVSAFSLGLAQALACAVGGFLGIIASFLLFNLQKEKRPIPALPPISMGSILGLLFGFLVF